jgi:hypothetical protein
MTELISRLLNRLAEVEFTTGTGTLTALGVELPLVRGWGWARDTGTLVLIAHDSGLGSELEREQAWRDLLFAASGLRRQAADGDPPALGVPIVIALVDEPDRAADLRRLGNDLLRNHVLFTRVELDIVDTHNVHDDNDLDWVLAAALPLCRRNLASEVAVGTVLLADLMSAIRTHLGARVQDLDDVLVSHAMRAAEEVEQALRASVPDDDSGAQPRLIEFLEVTNLRGFEEAKLDLAPCSFVVGANGTGKSTVIEAMELAWCGVSQRIRDAGPDEYDDSLRRDPNEAWEVKAGAVVRRRVTTEKVPSGLRRNVLDQASISGIAQASAVDRDARLLAVTGLATDAMVEQARALREEARQSVDRVLKALGIPALPRVNASSAAWVAERLGGAELLGESLASMAQARLADSVFRERAAADGLSVAPAAQDDEKELHRALVAFDQEAQLVARQIAPSDELERIAREVRALVSETRSALAGRLASQRAVLTALAAASSPAAAPVQDSLAFELPGVVASRWLNHARSLDDAARKFEADAATLADGRWADSLRRYAAQLSDVAASVPRAELAKISSAPTPEEAHRRVTPGAADLLAQIGIVPPREGLSTDVIAALRSVTNALELVDSDLARVLDRVDRHPACRLNQASAEDLRRAVARHEVVRTLPNPNGPLDRAIGEMLGRAVEGPLGGILAELVRSMTRFEWYFDRIDLRRNKNGLHLTNMVRERPNVDIRLLLNSAEASVVGMAWFLALHLLQPRERRQVLVIDDPSAPFDATNQSAFVETLRVVARLCRPDMIVIATHDTGLAQVLKREMVPVDGWPTRSSTLTLERAADGACQPVRAPDAESTVRPADPHHEAERLGLVGAATG